LTVIDACLWECAASLIFFMQAGFAMLEAGIVHPKNVTNILFKNMIDASLAAFFFWAIGYGVAYGTTATGGKGFIGSTNWGIGTSKNAIRNGGGDYMSSDGWESWMIQWAFAAKAVSIVAGSVAERTQLHAYFIYSCIFTLWIYPVVAHWVWGEGFLSPGSAVERPDWNPNGLIDFAGCGVVHMVGGYCGMVGAIVLGPRTGRFQLGGEVVELYTGNKTLQALGTFILWFGWYGFNAGSTLGLNGNLANIAGKVCVNTTMGGAMGGIAATFIYKGIFGIYDISMGLNGVLAGLNLPLENGVPPSPMCAPFHSSKLWLTRLCSNSALHVARPCACRPRVRHGQLPRDRAVACNHHWVCGRRHPHHRPLPPPQDQDRRPVRRHRCARLLR
jgi:Amt family ammonium transporter